MNLKRDAQMNPQQEVNLKLFLQKVYNNKWFFILSLCFFLGLALAYILVATPKYEVSTSILIDPSGNSRALGESKYVDGGVSLMELEKNLYNEIGIIKSFSLVDQTVTDLGFNISYYSGNWMKSKEHYKYFPFEVTLLENETQLFNVPFKIQILANEKYKLTIDANKFIVLNPSTGFTHEVDKALFFTQTFSFGEKVQNDYFNFIIDRPNYKISPGDFKDLELSFKVHDLDDVANGYLTNLKVDNIDIQASIFKIVSQGAVVNKETDFLKKLTDNYVQNKLASRNKTATLKESFIRNQLRIISDSLTRAELNLEMFKKDKRALNLGEKASNALGRTSNLQMDAAKYRMNINYYTSLIQNVEANSLSDDFVIPTAVGITDPLINENILELKRLAAERTKKRFYVTENNQEISILNKQIKESTSLLINNLRNAISSSNYALQRINSQLSSYDGVIESLPMQENQLLNIQRQSTLYENLFNYLSQELAKTGIARAENISDTRVLDEARMEGSGPVAPQKMLLLALAAILGTIIPIAWMVFFAPNDIIENANQITANTDIPLIASITNHDVKLNKNKAAVSLWKLKEAFRNLSANLKYIRPKEKCCVIGITSIMPEEGKSFCSINLGITLAEAGIKTLIIDADLRSPSLANGIKKINGKGLSNYLQGEVSNSKDIIYPYEKLKNLQFIPTTVLIQDNIHELLSGEKMKSLFLELSQEYDYIILDSPPVGLVSDFVLFKDVIDINLFVVRRKIAKIGFLKDFEKLLQYDKKKKSFIIFNDVMDKEHAYGYGHMYGTNGSGTQIIEESLPI
ncbi:GumC family protein [Algibacter sp.]|uniref:GumC family protein n=1 Tax=Algibacter sp. TaxID=1872428 RepID=UPI003C733720